MFQMADRHGRAVGFVEVRTVALVIPDPDLRFLHFQLQLSVSIMSVTNTQR